MVEQVSQIASFKREHSKVNEKIRQTYLISSKFQTYLEKRSILDAHFEGRQEQLFDRHPELKQKALDLLGAVLFYDLAPMSGKTLDTKNENFRKLCEIHE